MTEPCWEDIMKYDGSRPEPPYDTCESCSAYEAEITELQRRLDAVVAMLEPSAELIAKAEIDSQANFSLYITREFHARAVAIAEGRES